MDEENKTPEPKVAAEPTASVEPAPTADIAKKVTQSFAEKALEQKEPSSEKPAAEAAPEAEKPSEEPVSEKKKFNFSEYKTIAIGIGLAILAAVLWLLYSPTIEVAAKVNGEKITVQEVVNELERQGGQETLDNLVTERLILQAGEKNNATVTDEEIATELSGFESQLTAQGQTLEAYIASQGLTLDVFMKRVRIQLTLQKLVGEETSVSDEDIDAFIEDNSALLPEGVDTTDEIFREQVRSQIQQDNSQSAIQTYLDLLRQGSDIELVRQY